MAKVLIIDDDENNRLLLATLLRHASHTPLEASKGIPGAALAAAEKPDLIVVDLSLPDISGVDLLRRLRSDSRTANATIALYTATKEAAALDELVELYNIGGIIPKPGDPRQILAEFERLIG